MNLVEKTLKKSTVYEGDFLIYEKIQVELPDGNTANRDVIRHPGAVAVIAITEDNKVLFVEQYRKALDKITLEIPAGKIDKGESPEKSVVRELEEETGFKSDNIKFLGKIVTAPGFCDEYIHIYLAKDLKTGIKEGDEDEFINVKEFSMEEIKKMILNGEIYDSKTLSALLYVLI